ncbi:MAG: sensor histidine kinase [Planctomycetota bacterium]|jgi:signal transduction histidine kinase
MMGVRGQRDQAPLADPRAGQAIATTPPAEGGSPTRPFNLLRSFALLSVTVIAAIGIVSGIVILDYQERHIMQRDATVTMQFLQSLARQELAKPHPDGEHAQLLAELFMHVAIVPDVTRANIFDRDGTVIWSTEQGLIGHRFTNNPELQKALAGELVYKLHLGYSSRKLEHAAIPKEYAQFIETYVPIEHPVAHNHSGGVIGVVEIYKLPGALSLALKQGQYLIWGGGAIGALVLYVSLFWIVRRASRVIHRQHRWLTREVEAHMDDKETLRASERKLRALSSKLLRAQEQERKKIALELHDGLGQILSAAKFRLESRLNRPGPGAAEEGMELVRGAVGKIQDAIEEVRNIAMDLRPSILDDLGILATLDWFCREFQQVYPDIRINKHTALAEDDIPGALKVVIYRVVQEALNNVAKHARASQVDLDLGATRDELSLRIADNGRGFDLNHYLQHLGNYKGTGLQSMRERCELSLARFSIESSRDAGTVIQASWPRGA